MRGEKEQRCLNIVRNNCSSKENLKKYFGLFQEDIEEIDNILKSAKPNAKPSAFPDFIFGDGFIEHFQITSSKTNKHGAKHLKQESCFKNKVKEEKAEIQEEWNNNPFSNGIHSKSWAFKYPEHKYEYLEESLKNRWKKHMKSWNKYTGNKNIGIFMIEYSDLALTMYENVYADWIDGMTNGDMKEPEKVEFYRLTRDKNLLKNIYSFKDNIKYVIFVYGKECEIIKLKSIPYLLKLIPWNYVIAPYMGTTLISSMYNFSIQIPVEKKGNIDNE